MLGSCPGSTGPRLHDYAIGGGRIGVTQFRPGVLGVPTAPMPVPAQTREDDALNLLALRSESLTPASVPLSSSPSHFHSHSHSHSLSASHASRERERRRSNAYEYSLVSGSATHAYTPHLNSGWSLPRSSVRSKSGSSGSRSRSQSASESRSDDEDEGVFGDVGVGVDMDGARVHRSPVRAWNTEDGDGGVTEISEDGQEGAEDMKRGAEQPWDGMEMEMEMN